MRAWYVSCSFLWEYLTELEGVTEVAGSGGGRAVIALGFRSKRSGVQFPRLATWISEIGYLLFPSRDMAEIQLERRKSSIQPKTLQPTNRGCNIFFIEKNNVKASTFHCLSEWRDLISLVSHNRTSPYSRKEGVANYYLAQL